MNNNTLPAAQLIAHPHALHKLSEKLRCENKIAVDTESNSLYAYQEQVCLIQFSTPTQDFLVDPFALNDLSPLKPIFANQNIEKVFHASEYDVICLKRDFGFAFRNIFDTFTAARVLGRKAVGLGSILESEFSVEVNKRYQRANWGQRPLPSHLLAYAQLDTHYLIPLRDRLKAELMDQGLMPLAQEDFNRVCLVNGHNCVDKSNEWWRINGAMDLPAQKAAILQELCRFRDRLAQRVNKPLFKVYNDWVLLELAKECPQSPEALENLGVLNSRQLKRDSEAILSAIKKGLISTPVYPNRVPRPSERFLNRLEKLRKWRKTTGEKMGVSSDIILPRDLLSEIAETNPANESELQAIMRSVPWRMEQFGSQIIGIIHSA
ncbi:MAG: HRDC domain-containing protein [Anaerolineales bacterium]|nr:HRDC domain-containing protein [Anaerolineales bacterium]